MKLNKKFVWLMSIVISLLISSYAWGIGLEVDPGEINIKYVPLGKKIAVSELGGEKLKIHNKSAASYTYTINILFNSETTAPLKGGYVDIPDTSWIWPEKKEVLVPGNGTKEVELFLKVPRKKRYKDKKFQAIIEVKSKKNRPEDIFVLACQLKVCFSTQKPEKKAKADKYPRKLIIIKTKDRWAENPSFVRALKRRFPGIKLEELDYSTKQGRKLAEKLDIDFLPAYIFGKDIERNSNFPALKKATLIQPLGDNYYLYASPQTNGIFINRQSTPQTLEVFSMSQCPFSIAALKEIITAERDGQLPPGLKLTLHYIAKEVEPSKPYGEKADELKFDSLHGESEVGEDIRQLCIKKYFPEKFFDYLLLRNKDIRSADWQVPAEEAGVGIEAIKNSALNEEGKTLLKEDIKKAEELNISSSPTFLYENRVLIGDFNLLKELPGLEALAVGGSSGKCAGE